jgi:hypothetical protein
MYTRVVSSGIPQLNLCNEFGFAVVRPGMTRGKIWLLLVVTVFQLTVAAQKKCGIELLVTGRYDRHANYVSNYANRAYNDTMKLYGPGLGIEIAYRREIPKTFSIYLGAGYYQIGIDRIHTSMPFNAPGTRTARSIDYDDGSTNLAYSTSRYHYNNISAMLGINKTFRYGSYFPELGLEARCYSTFSQRYRLDSGDKSYATSNSKPLEFGLNMTLGIVKELNNFYIRPAILVPIYQNLKGDKIFFEDRKMNIPKWFNGIGATLRIGRYV